MIAVTDIVERLRRFRPADGLDVALEAADEIERLRAELEASRPVSS